MAQRINVEIPIYWINQGAEFELIVGNKYKSDSELQNYFCDDNNVKEIEDGIRTGRFQRIIFSSKIKKIFEEQQLEFENCIAQYQYKSYKIWELGLLYVIEEDVVIYMSVKPENQNRIVIEALFDNGHLKMGLDKYYRNHSVAMFWKFMGLGYCNPYRISSYKLICDTNVPIDIKKMYDEWEGFPVSFAVYELDEANKKGYAISQTNMKQTYKNILEIGNDILFACVTNSQEQKKNIMSWHGLKYSFVYDEEMYDIIMGRWQGKYDISWRKDNLQGGKLGIEEKGMKYFWLTTYTKKRNFEILADIRDGKYDDVDRYEYIIPENKWKSEQIVYELVRKIYPKHSVFHQYRPEFLRRGNSQMSYDVYIPKLRLAIEYQGKQHFEPVEIFGGEENFQKQIERDAEKKRLSDMNNVTLVYINYWDDLSVDLIKQRILEVKSSGNRGENDK